MSSMRVYPRPDASNFTSNRYSSIYRSLFFVNEFCGLISRESSTSIMNVLLTRIKFSLKVVAEDPDVCVSVLGYSRMG